MKVVDTREYVGMLKELTEEGKEVSMLVFGSSMAPFLIHARDMIYFKKPDRELQKDQAGGVLYRGRCTDTDRRTGKERADICSDHQSQKKRKVAGAGRFLVGILRACMAAYDSAPPGDYVVLCEGDTVTRLHTDGGNAMMEQ